VSEPALGQQRRWLLSAGVASAAVAAGAAAYLWQRRAQTLPGDARLWSLEFETPSQSRLAMTSLRGQPLVLNFWATWCPPCVREMPALDRFFHDHMARGWRVLGIAADNAAPVREFLARSPVAFPIALAGFAGVELSRDLGNTSGGLPFTVIYDSRGRVARRHIGETHYEQLTVWAEGIS
jgi:thiol-disulfide isomerase/thioredoxin